MSEATDNKDNFQGMLSIAELASKMHHDRRQLTFKIEIAYVTLLALAIYHIIKIDNEMIKDIPLCIIFVVSGFLTFVHIIFYCKWQKMMHIASSNDVRRRDFYLKKAECLGHHMSKNLNTHFVPSS